MTNRTCNKCDRVAFTVTRAFAIEQVHKFTEYYNGLDEYKKKEYYGNRPASIKDYETCGCGNPHTNFRETVDGDCPDGCTISPIIFEEDNA